VSYCANFMREEHLIERYNYLLAKVSMADTFLSEKDELKGLARNLNLNEIKYKQELLKNNQLAKIFLKETENLPKTSSYTKEHKEILSYVQNMRSIQQLIGNRDRTEN